MRSDPAEGQTNLPVGVMSVGGARAAWSAIQELRSLLDLPLEWDPAHEGLHWLWRSTLRPAIKIRCAGPKKERLGDVWRTSAGGLVVTFTKHQDYNEIVGHREDGSAIRAGGFLWCLRMADDLRSYYGTPEDPVPLEQFTWVHCDCEGARPLKPGSLARLSELYESSLRSVSPLTFYAQSAQFAGSRAEARERNAR